LAKHSSYKIKVFYTLGANINSIVDNGFGTIENWNIDLLSGYEYEFIENISAHPSSLKYNGIKNPSLIKKIQEYNPDSIVVYGWKHQSHLSVLNYFHGKVLILFRGDSTTLDDSIKFSLRSYFRYLILKWVYQKVDYVLSPGSASDKYYMKSGLNQNQIIRAEHAVDNERFKNLTNSEQEQLFELSSTLLIKPNENIFLFAGKFIHKKNPLLLLEAFVELKRQKENARLLLVGNGILEKRIKERINLLPLDIASSITLLPFQDQHQIKLLYRVATVFVLPSISETWGLSVNEALASGIPVIISDKCGSSKNLVKNDVNGFIFKSGDIQDLLQKMHIMCDDNLVERLSLQTVDSLKQYTYHSFKKSLDRIFAINEN
jgi:glycosyltransferase involved in cell wall biosynthesis